MRIKEKKGKFYVVSGYLWWKKVHKILPTRKTAERYLK